MKQRLSISLLMTLALITHSALAEIVVSQPDHYQLVHEGVSEQSVEQVWDRLINPDQWWHPEHTYSGDAANLSLNLTAGGQWQEQSDTHTVSHGTVLFVNPPYQLKLNAPFGPLQGKAVTVVWTITLEALDQGTRVTFEEIANGTSASALDELAPAVDFVKAEALHRLVSPPGATQP